MQPCSANVQHGGASEATLRDDVAGARDYIMYSWSQIKVGSTIPWTGPGFWTGLDSGLDS